MNMNEAKTYVIDTSVTAKLFLIEEQREQAKQIYRQAISKALSKLSNKYINEIRASRYSIKKSTITQAQTYYNKGES